MNSVDEGGLELWSDLFVSNRTLVRKTRGKRRNEAGKEEEGGQKNLRRAGFGQACY